MGYSSLNPDRHILSLSEYRIPNVVVPDFSFAEDWPLSVKACTYALYAIPHDGVVHDWDSLRFIYINELICNYYGITCPEWPFSVADVVHALGKIFGSDDGESSADSDGDPSGSIKAFDIHHIGSLRFEAWGVAPIYYTVKHWLASGIPVIAAIRLHGDWDMARLEGIHKSQLISTERDYVDASVIVIEGWNDMDSTFLFRYMEGDRCFEDHTAKIAVNEVVGQHALIELVAIASY
jgi:hypothetical protein